MYLLASGRRGDVFVEEVNGIKYAIKKAKDDTKKGSIQREIVILNKLKEYNIDFVPQLLAFSDSWFKYKFIEGETLDKVKNPSKSIYIELIEHAYVLDSLHIEHGELSKPTKNIIISPDNRVFIIDFERGNLMNNTGKNLKGLTQFLFREKIIDLDLVKKLSKISELETVKNILKSKLK